MEGRLLSQDIPIAAIGLCRNSPFPGPLLHLACGSVPILTTPDLDSLPRPAVLFGSQPCERFASAVSAAPDLAYVLVTTGSEDLSANDWVDAVVVEPTGIDQIVRAGRAGLAAKQSCHRPRPIVGDRALGWQGVTLPISGLEATVLRILVAARGHVVERGRIARAIWGPYATDPGRAVDAHVYRLRRRMVALDGIEIETVRKRGFRLVTAGFRVDSKAMLIR
ncbi:MAG: helix-turn-helix domain-containing protein [Dehalococcoidia bacterium]